MYRYRKVKQYPRPHDAVFEFGLTVNSKTHATILPLLRYDEGLGTPTTYKANPRNSNFADVGDCACFPDSRINRLFCEVEISNTLPVALYGSEAVNVNNVRSGYIGLIQTSFGDELDMADEKTALKVRDILHLSKNTNHKQVYPTWNSKKLPYTSTATASSLTANEPGLSSPYRIQGVTFSKQVYYDAKHYYTIKDKLKKVLPTLHRFTCVGAHPKRFRFRVTSKTKRINPYTFLGVLIGQDYGVEQIGGTLLADKRTPADTLDKTGTSVDTNGNIFNVKVRYRYNEWNDNFNMLR